MRHIGTSAYGIRLPIITSGDNLPEIVADSLIDACSENGLQLEKEDVIGITEAIVAKSQGNYATLEDIAEDVRTKFPDGEIGVVFPIMSRNRFLNILKGIAMGAKKVYVLMSYPNDEVGNPIMDAEKIDDYENELKPLMTGDEFKKITDNYLHPFTAIDYISLYENVSDNIEVYVSNDQRQILKLTENVIVAEIHSRFRTKRRLEKAGAKNVYTLSDILSTPVNGSGFNHDYGVLGSNMSTDSRLKLFPRDCEEVVAKTREEIFRKTGINIEVLVYGDGAFKDPACGIWELADPVVSPAYTNRLGGQPNEIKLKYVADQIFQNLDGAEKTKAVTEMIKEKTSVTGTLTEGTTPRRYYDLLGSLCDLMSGSGDKGTPVILVKGYFDNYASE